MVDFSNQDHELTGGANQKGQDKLVARLNALQSSDSGVVVDPKFLSCAEYQLFVDHLRHQDKNNYPPYWYSLPLEDRWEEAKYYHQPDHWTSYTYSEGEADLPIAGVRGTDALAFCDWLNARVKARPFYRLPTPQEAQLYPPDPTQPGQASWCFDGTSFSLAGLNDELIYQIKQELEAFTSPPYPKLRTNLLKMDLDSFIKEGFGFDSDFSQWDYRKITIPLLPGALDPILGLYYGDPGRALAVATNYESAYAQDLAFLISWARKRNLRDRLNEVRKHTEYKLTLSGFTTIATAIEHERWLEASKLISQLRASPDEVLQRWSVLLRDVMNIMRARTFLELRKAVREHVAHLGWFIYFGYAQKLIQTSQGQWLDKSGIDFKETFPFTFQQRLNSDREALSKISWRLDNLFTSLYWQMQILLARESNHLRSREGIRLVADYS